VGGFMTGSREKERDVVNESDHEELWGKIRHKPDRLGFRREESKRVGGD